MEAYTKNIYSETNIVTLSVPSEMWILNFVQRCHYLSNNIYILQTCLERPLTTLVLAHRWMGLYNMSQEFKGRALNLLVSETGRMHHQQL